VLGQVPLETLVLVLAVPAALIYAAFGGQTSPLIPLFAIGVFLAFTMSQAGMVVHWWRRRDDARWRRSLFFNATGGTLSAIVFLTAALTKFTMGRMGSAAGDRPVRRDLTAHPPPLQPCRRRDGAARRPRGCPDDHRGATRRRRSFLVSERAVHSCTLR